MFQKPEKHVLGGEMWLAGGWKVDHRSELDLTLNIVRCFMLN